MKKYLALILCALMVLSMASIAFAAEENAFEYNFEDDDEGDFIAIDNSIRFYPKQGSVEVVKMDGSNVIKLDQTNYADSSGNMDNYVDFVQGPVSTYGVETKYVLEYDVKFDKACTEGMNWQICCSRETPAGAGTQFQHVGYFRGNGTITATGVEEPVGTFEFDKWYTVSACIDKENKVFSLYVDGICLAKDLDYTIADNSAAESERIRSGFGNIPFGDNAIAYLDNIKIYNATEPRNVKQATPAPVTTAAPATEAPVTTAAPATTTAAPVTAAPAPTTTPAAKTADAAVVIALVAAITAAGAVVIKKH